MTSAVGTDLYPEIIDPARGSRFLEGTSDMIEDDQHHLLNKRANAYARRYNLEVMRITGYTAVERATLRAMKARQDVTETQP